MFVLELIGHVVRVGLPVEQLMRSADGSVGAFVGRFGVAGGAGMSRSVALLEAARADVRVDLGRHQALVPEQFLHAAGADTVFLEQSSLATAAREQDGGEGVPAIDQIPLSAARELPRPDQHPVLEMANWAPRIIDLLDRMVEDRTLRYTTLEETADEIRERLARTLPEVRLLEELVDSAEIEEGPMGHMLEDRYLRRHWFHIKTDRGLEMKLYFERTGRAGAGRAKRWYVYTIIDAEKAE